MQEVTPLHLLPATKYLMRNRQNILMQFFEITLLLFFGGLAIYFQIKQVKRRGLFLDDFSLAAIWLVVTCILTLVLLLQGFWIFKHKQRFYRFLPALIGLMLILLVLGHRFYRNMLNKRQTLFQAINYDIGSDGGFTFDFKQGGYLQGAKVDRFSTTYYWGRFTRQKDTLLLKIPLDFKLGRRAYIQNANLRFQDDTTEFNIFVP